MQRSSSHLNNLDIRKAVKESLQVNAIQNNSVIINMTIGLKINDCFFLLKKKSCKKVTDPLPSTILSVIL